MKDDLLAEINITPLTDVILVLLIIFLLVAGAYSQLKASPKSSAALIHKAPLQIAVSREGLVSVAGEPVPLENLSRVLTARAKSLKTAQVCGEQDTPYGKILAVLETAQASGFSDISLGGKAGGRH